MASPLIVTVDATEKLYADFQLEVTNAGGHSSLPVPNNAIYPSDGCLGAAGALQVSIRAE